MRRFFTIFTVVANLVLADAVVKEFAAGLLKNSAAKCVIPNIFNLAYVENRGCAYGMFQGAVWPLALFGVIAIAVLIWKRRSIFTVSTTAPRWIRWGVLASEPLMIAGIIGNSIDRFFRGYVVDMFDFHWYGAHFPCFNLADTYLCTAVGILIISSFFSNNKKVVEPKTT